MCRKKRISKLKDVIYDTLYCYGGNTLENNVVVDSVVYHKRSGIVEIITPTPGKLIGQRGELSGRLATMIGKHLKCKINLNIKERSYEKENRV